jgi:hypothetical protein
MRDTVRRFPTQERADKRPGDYAVSDVTGQDTTRPYSRLAIGACAYVDTKAG